MVKDVTGLVLIAAVSQAPWPAILAKIVPTSLTVPGLLAWISNRQRLGGGIGLNWFCGGLGPVTAGFSGGPISRSAGITWS